MEIGSKAKKIIVWSASGLAAAGLLTGTFFTGMAVADNTEPASAISEADGERPERPERGDHRELPQDNDSDGSESQDKSSGDKGSQNKESGEKDSGGKDTPDAQEKGSRDEESVRPDRPERDGSDRGDGHGERGGHGPRHGHPESEAEAPAEDAPAQS